MSKKKKTIEELLEEALVREEEQPYKVPENWRWTKLGNIIKSVKGKKPKELYEVEEEGTIPYVTISYLTNGTTKETQYLPENISKVRCKEDDILMVWDGARSGFVGKGVEGEVGSTLAKLEKKKIDTNFLYYFLKFKYEYIKSNHRGTGIPHVNPEVLWNIDFPVPPLSEQKRIAEKIECLLNKIKEAKDLIEEAKKTFELRREAIFKKAFSGELTEAWRKENHSTQTPIDRFNKIKDERISIIDNKRELKEVTKLFEEFDISKNIDDNNWINLKANMFCENISCGSTPKKYNEPTDKVPFLKVYNIVNNKIDFDYKPQYIGEEAHEGKQRKSKVLPDDVLMNIVGPPLRKVAIVPNDFPEYNINQNMVRFRPLSFVLPKYIFYCLQYEKTLNKAINSTVGVVGQIIINISICREIEIPIPPLEEQREIVRILEELIDKEEKALDFLSNENLIDLTKQAILSKAFHGELGTNDPSEESVIELLKEVLQEKVK
ncbi:TPA: restriction endonuclease subunit S [Bacillus cereus]